MEPLQRPYLERVRCRFVGADTQPFNYFTNRFNRNSKNKLSDPNFRRKLQQLVKIHQSKIERPCWFQQNHAETPLKQVAYFCMESC